jgi:hypothetical protein
MSNGSVNAGQFSSTKMSIMKRTIAFPVLMLGLLGLSVSSSAQDEKTLPEVRVTATNYKYIKAVDNKDLYLVSYEDAGGAKKLYKLVLENNNKHLRVKLNEKGEFK